MNPKEQADDLIEKMFVGELHVGMASRCAIVAVETILKINSVDKDVDLSEYWTEVKLEIEKVKDMYYAKTKYFS